MDWVMRHLQRLAADERAAAAKVADLAGQLQTLNQHLEVQVASQVAEIDKLRQLRRFLSPQIAEAVMSAGDGDLLAPHRRQIAVFFCDLRGFTAFTNSAEPEEVVEALDEYFKIVGEALQRHNATVGAFAGDGIMAYLNDPVPCNDPPTTAVEMALALRDPMLNLMNEWKRRGFDLGYGVGIAYGYATLGTVGFEWRSDYMALGSIVNLAARLCGEAATGQTLIDSRTASGLQGRFRVAERELLLKGFPAPIRACEVIGVSDQVGRL
jgi:class 3 adenylate cyclase